MDTKLGAREAELVAALLAEQPDGADVIEDLVTCSGFLGLSATLQRLAIAYLVAANDRTRRMAWSFRSLVQEAGFVAGDQRTQAAWIYLYGEEVLAGE